MNDSKNKKILREKSMQIFRKFASFARARQKNEKWNLDLYIIYRRATCWVWLQSGLVLVYHGTHEKLKQELDVNGKLIKFECDCDRQPVENDL